jgi:predicted nucleic acid-binding protein
MVKTTKAITIAPDIWERLSELTANKSQFIEDFIRDKLGESQADLKINELKSKITDLERKKEIEAILASLGLDNFEISFMNRQKEPSINAYRALNERRETETFKPTFDTYSEFSKKFAKVKEVFG